MKNLNLALVLALAQLIRLFRNKLTKISEPEEKKYLFGLETIYHHLKVAKVTNKEITEKGEIWLIAYLDLDAIKIDCNEDEQKITLPK